MKKKLSLLFALLLTPNAFLLSQHKTNVAVFCSADDKASIHFKQLAHQLGAHLAQHNFGLVTGGSRTGLMKEVIDGYANNGANIQNLYGILPQALINYNVHHLSIPTKNLIWSKDIHNRLSDFHALADTIIILPGGYGTLHEMMDFLVHNQFGIHKTRIIVLNADGYWNDLLALFHSMIKHQLLTAKHFEMLQSVDSIEQCMSVIKGAESCATQQDLTSHYWERSK